MEKEKIQVLLLEDDFAEAQIIKQMLADSKRQEFQVQHVVYLSEALVLLQNQVFDVVLVDLGLPDSQGLDTALTVRMRARDTPIVVLTVLDDEETADRSLLVGIDDYLMKSEISRSLLTRTILYAIRRKSDISRIIESEQRFASFMQNLPAAAWMKDLKGRYVYANREAERVFTIPFQELSGKTDMDVFPPETARQFSENDGLVLAQGGSLQTTEVLRQQNGIDHHSIVSKFVVLSPQGEPQYVAGVAFDITERKIAERVIERLNKDLAARTAELESLNSELEAFNFTVAHDLRKPLTVINCSCQEMMDICGERLDEECRGLLQEAFDGTLRMDRLIDALLELSRLSSGRLSRETVDLTEMAGRIAEELQGTEPLRRVNFVIAEGMVAECDQELIRVVLENLLGNAWKFTGKLEEAVIEVGTEEVEGNKAWYVRDNGTGFEMGQARDLFVPFHRLPGGEEFKGFGIGLATVDRIIRRHLGKVWAESEPGKGAVFYFTLGRD